MLDDPMKMFVYRDTCTRIVLLVELVKRLGLAAYVSKGVPKVCVGVTVKLSVVRPEVVLSLAAMKRRKFGNGALSEPMARRAAMSASTKGLVSASVQSLCAILIHPLEKSEEHNLSARQLVVSIPYGCSVGPSADVCRHCEIVVGGHHEISTHLSGMPTCIASRTTSGSKRDGCRGGIVVSINLCDCNRAGWLRAECTEPLELHEHSVC